MSSTPTCGNCGAVNAAGAKFCSSCSTPMGAQRGPQQQAQPQGAPFVQTAPPSGSTSQTRHVYGDPGDVHAKLAQAMTASGGEVRMQSPGHSLSGISVYKDLWKTSGMPIKFETTGQFQPGGSGSTIATVTTKTDWSSIVPMVAIFVTFTFVMILLNPAMGVFFLLLGVAAVGLTAWQASAQFPTQQIDRLFAAIGASDAQKASPGPAAAASPPPADSATSNDVARLKRLNELKEAGAITPEEYEAKKAEILASL